MTVVDINSLRPSVCCPNCEQRMTLRQLDQHLRYDCPALGRRHPSNGGGAA